MRITSNQHLSDWPEATLPVVNGSSSPACRRVMRGKQQAPHPGTLDWLTVRNRARDCLFGFPALFQRLTLLQPRSLFTFCTAKVSLLFGLGFVELLALLSTRVLPPHQRHSQDPHPTPTRARANNPSSQAHQVRTVFPTRQSFRPVCHAQRGIFSEREGPLRVELCTWAAPTAAARIPFCSRAW